jgi:hypothetical protein
LRLGRIVVGVNRPGPKEVQMSGIPHLHVPVRLRGVSARLSMTILALLVICAVAVSVILISSGSDSQSGASTVTPSSQVGGPNEAARGQAAATSAGAFQPTQVGGPDETARGQSAATASRP